MKNKRAIVLFLFTLLVWGQSQASCTENIDMTCRVYSEQMQKEKSELGTLIATLMEEKGYCFVDTPSDDYRDPVKKLTYKNGCYEYSNSRCTEGRAKLTLRTQVNNTYSRYRIIVVEGESNAILGFIGKASGRVAVIRAIDKLPECGTEKGNSNW